MTKHPDVLNVRIPVWLWKQIKIIAKQETRQTGLRRSTNAQLVQMLTNGIGDVPLGKEDALGRQREGKATPR